MAGGPAKLDEVMIGLISTSPADIARYRGVYEQVTKLLRHVLPETDIVPFLQTIAIGRYGVVPRGKSA
jgi:hypothetical protein